MEILDQLQEATRYAPHDAHVVIRDEDGMEYGIEAIGVDDVGTEAAQVVIKA